MAHEAYDELAMTRRLQGIDDGFCVVRQGDPERWLLERHGIEHSELGPTREHALRAVNRLIKRHEIQLALRTAL
jgi:hypothetical protein